MIRADSENTSFAGSAHVAYLLSAFLQSTGWALPAYSVLIWPYGYFKLTEEMQSGTTPLELLALLLFDPPDVLTLYSLLALFVLASNTHQFRVRSLIAPTPYLIIFLTSSSPAKAGGCHRPALPSVRPVVSQCQKRHRQDQ